MIYLILILKMNGSGRSKFTKTMQKPIERSRIKYEKKIDWQIIGLLKQRGSRI